MPSTLIPGSTSGVRLTSGSVYAAGDAGAAVRGSTPGGSAAGLQMKLSNSGAGPVYVAVPRPGSPGITPTMNSGGALTAGGLDDGMELAPGESYFLPASRLDSGVLTPVVLAPAASSGARMYWECI